MLHKKILTSVLFSYLLNFLGTVEGLYVSNGQIYNDTIADENNDTPIYLKGVSWFGFETQDFVINGLWVHPMSFYLDLLQSINVNFLRIPFSSEWIHYNYDLYPYDGLLSADPSLQRKKSIEILDHLVDECAKRGIGVMFDLHRLHKEFISELWYSATDDSYPSSVFFQTWTRLLSRYEHCDNILAIDLLNEPHGQATWGTGNPATDWNSFVEYAIPELDTLFPNSSWLYVMEGIEWGQSFIHYRQTPISLPEHLDRRLVMSPHTYGKSVVPSTTNDPNQLFSNWDTFFGFLLTDYERTILPGEWGGRTDLDTDWMWTLSKYLRSRNIVNNCFWSLGPNSDDVHGLLLNDWTTLDQVKVDVMKSINPHPTSFSFHHRP